MAFNISFGIYFNDIIFIIKCENLTNSQLQIITENNPKAVKILYLWDSIKRIKNIENNIINFITDTDFGGKTLKDSSGNSFRNNIIDQDILNNNFLASIYGKTFTPTAGMQSINPSVTLWDNTSGDVEQILTAGVLSYVSF